MAATSALRPAATVVFVVAAACDSGGGGGGPGPTDATFVRVDAWVSPRLDAAPWPRDVPREVPNLPFDAARPRDAGPAGDTDGGGGADARVDEPLPWLPRNRETVLALVKARQRMAACIEKVYGEPAFAGASLHHKFLEELNPRPEPGYRGIDRRTIDCDLPAFDCEAFLACIDVRPSLVCDPTATFGGAAGCVEDDVRVWCVSGSSRGPVTYCREVGGYCPEGWGANNGCYVGDCDGLDAPTPCGDGVRYYCDGFHLVGFRCAQEVLCHPFYVGDSLRCARYGQPRCRRLDEGDGYIATRCTAEGEACDPRVPARCLDEYTVEGCAWPGFMSRLRCDEFFEGATCVPQRADGLGAACSMPAEECDSNPRCQDDRYLRTCPMGEWEVIDCAAMGMYCKANVYTIRPSRRLPISLT
jgi:hypothetical protein